MCPGPICTDKKSKGFRIRNRKDCNHPGLAQRATGPFEPGTPKESKKSPKGCPEASSPGEPQSPQRVRPGVRKESKKSLKLRFWTLFGLRGALVGDSGARGAGGPGTPFRTLLGFRALRSPLCPRSGGLQRKDLNKQVIICGRMVVDALILRSQSPFTGVLRGPAPEHSCKWRLGSQPDRKNFQQIAVLGGPNRRSKSCDL